MSYTVVPIETKLQALRGQVENAKSTGAYDGHEQPWDELVAKLLTTECRVGEHNVKTNAEFIENQRNLAKLRMDSVEQLLKKNELSDLEHKMIEETPAHIRQCLSRINGDLQDLVTANLQYRGGWPALSRDLLSPARKGIVEPFVTARSQQIDGQAAVMAKKKRCEEYVERAVEFAKQAQQRKNRGKVDVDSFNVDVQKIKQSMVTGKAAISELHVKKARAIESVKALEKKKVWTPDDSKSAKSWLAEIAANAKNARGNLKTLTVAIEGLEKRGKAAGPGWKDLAAKAVDEAKKPYKEAFTASKNFEADEEKCKKICKDHGITV